MKITQQTEQDLVMKALSEEDPDAVVTPSATVSEQGTDTKADAEESMGVAMKMCQDWTSWKTYLAQVLPRWSSVWSVFEVSRLVPMNNVQVVDFDMCRFGNLDRGGTRLLTNSLQMAQKANRRCASRLVTSSKGNRHEDSRQLRLRSHAFQGNPYRHRISSTRRRQDRCILDGGRSLR